MNWHETIEFISQKEEYKDLVRFGYFDKDLKLNVSRFGASNEYLETLNLIRKYVPNAQKILDIGAGNGISSINLALSGYKVFAIEPDPSNLVGRSAINKLKEDFNLDQLSVFNHCAEDMDFPDESFDLVYIRQAMHHANDLEKFLRNVGRVLKKGGYLFTIRDHAVFSSKDKELFLNYHPLHMLYGGENAFSPETYRQAMGTGGLKVVEEIKYFDSEINYYPYQAHEIAEIPSQIKRKLKEELKYKLGIISRIPFVLYLYKIKNGYWSTKDYFNEELIPGRMYSYIARKI